MVNLQTDQVIRTIRYAALPAPGSQEEIVAVGAEMFFSSRGNFDRPAGTTVSTSERLSSDAWQSCASCHFKGLTDSVVWAFGTGPRKSLPLNASFNPNDRNQQKILNYSAVNDEIEDFSLNISQRLRSRPARGGRLPCDAPAAGQPATSTFEPESRPDLRRQREHQPAAVRDQRDSREGERRTASSSQSRCPAATPPSPRRRR